MGCFRLLLASAVMLTHFDVFSGADILPGRVAVVSFFLISGFVMTGLIRRNYARLRDVPAFYLDRCARLYPQFLVYLVMALYVRIGLQGHPAEFMLNVLMLPLGYFMWLPAGTELLLIAPTWSLGLEATFYLVFPFILLCGLRDQMAVLSISIFGCAVAGLIDPDTYGYFLLPGTLFIFLCGSWLYDSSRFPRKALVIWLLSAVAYVGALAAPGIVHLAFVMLGLLIGIPTLWLLRVTTSNKWDRLAGDLSYGVFLNHQVIWLVAAHYDLRSHIIAMCCASILMAWITYQFVERPVLELRGSWRRARSRGAPALAA